jgi:hypothetical protein
VTGYDAGYNAVEYTNASDGHYIVVSHGELGIGAYSAKGVPTQNCVLGSGSTIESENCNTDGYYFSYREPMPVPAGQQCDDPTNVPYIPCFVKAHSLNDGPGYYDDITIYRNTKPARIWSHIRNAPTEDELFQSDIFTYAAFVGIGTEEPFYSLDVVGNIKAQGADAFSEYICDDQQIANPGDNYFDKDGNGPLVALGGELMFNPDGSPMALNCYQSLMIAGPPGDPAKSTRCDGTQGALSHIAGDNPDGILDNADDLANKPLPEDRDLCGSVTGVKGNLMQTCGYPGVINGIDENGNPICNHESGCTNPSDCPVMRVSSDGQNGTLTRPKMECVPCSTLPPPITAPSGP